MRRRTFFKRTGVALGAIPILGPSVLAREPERGVVFDPTDWEAVRAQFIASLSPLLVPWCRLTILSGIVAVLVGASAAAAQDSFDPEARLVELGLELPPPYKPIANYVRAVRAGNLVFLGGHSECEEPHVTGKVGSDRTVDEGYSAARLTALCLLASLKAEIGDLRKVVRIVRVYGMVNATESFTGHSKVVNGASDLLVEIFGTRGRHARAAVGMASLPLNLTVEIEMVVEVSDD